MRRAVLVLTLFGLVAASCGGSSSERDYNVAIRNAFLENCQYEGGDPSSCAASLECIEEQLTQEEFEYEENWLFLRGEFSDRMTGVLATCMVKAAALAQSTTAQQSTARVPLLVGDDEVDAAATIVEAGWLAESRYERRDCTREGQVLSTELAFGAELEEGGTVVLVVSLGSARVAVPTVPTSWPSSSVQNFIGACVEANDDLSRSRATSLCECVLAEIQGSGASYEDYTTLNNYLEGKSDEVTESGLRDLFPWFTDAVDACAT